MGTMISMNTIRRVGVLIAAAVVVPFAALAVGGCGGTTTAADSVANGLETKTPAQVVHDAAAALAAAKSVQIVLTRGPSQVDLRVQGGSRTLTFTDRGAAKFEVMVIGKNVYAKFLDQAALNTLLGALPPRMHIFGQWLRVAPKRLNLGGLEGFSPASLAGGLTRHGPLEPAVRQATLSGRKVVVVTDQRNGAKLYVANTGPAYPLLITGFHGQRIGFSDYGANFHITAPSNAIPAP